MCEIQQRPVAERVFVSVAVQLCVVLRKCSHRSRSFRVSAVTWVLTLRCHLLAMPAVPMDVAGSSSAASSLTQEEFPGQKLLLEYLGRHVPYDDTWHFVYQVQGENPWEWFDLDANLSLQLDQQAKSPTPGIIEAPLAEGSPLYRFSASDMYQENPRSGKRRLLRRVLVHIDAATTPSRLHSIKEFNKEHQMETATRKPRSRSVRGRA